MNARGTILLAAALAHTGFAAEPTPRLDRANLLLHHTAEGKVAPVKTLTDSLAALKAIKNGSNTSGLLTCPTG